jgi:hypothetical protein
MAWCLVKPSDQGLVVSKALVYCECRSFSLAYGADPELDLGTAGREHDAC